MTGQAHAGRPSKLFRNLNAKIASIPMILTALVIFPRRHDLDSRLFLHQFQAAAAAKFVGFDQYERLWDAPRWLISIQNLAIYGVLSLIFSLVIGFVLAA
jgi:glucose/mannose transport system permease protein